MNFPARISILALIFLSPLLSWADDTAPADSSTEKINSFGTQRSNILEKGDNLSPTSKEFAPQTIFYTERTDNPLLKPDLKKDSSFYTKKPFKLLADKKKSRAMVTCNMSWQKMTNLSAAEKSQYQMGNEKSATASVNAPILVANKDRGIPEPPGTLRDLTATFKTSQNGLYYMGSLTCKIREYLVDGKVQSLTQGEILAVLKQNGFEHRK